MFSEDTGSRSREDDGWKEAREQELVLPVDGDGAACQRLALQPGRVLVFTHLTTHAPVAALGTAGALIQHPTHKDLAVQKYLLQG